MNEHLNYFVTAAHSTRASAALGKLVLTICRTDQVSRSFLSAAERL